MQTQNEARKILSTSVLSSVIIFATLMGLGAGYMGGSVNQVTNTMTQVMTQTQVSSTTVVKSQTTTVTQSSFITQTVTSTSTAMVSAKPSNATLAYVIVPDFGGGGYDAYILTTSFNGSVPKHATNTTNPGPNNNNATVPAGVPVRFVIMNLDEMMFNFSGKVTTSFSFLNNTEAGQVAVQYQPGQSIKNLAISHTFTISQLGLNIPIPPLTTVTFTYTFAKPGVYQFICQTPCGDGMTTPGYMQGYVIVGN